LGTFDSKEWRECFNVFKNKRWLWVGDNKSGFWILETKKFCLKIYEAGWRGTYLSGKNLKDRRPEDFLQFFKKFTLKVVINDYNKNFKESKVFETVWEKAFILRKKSEEELLRDYKKSLREDIRRGEKQGLIFKELNEDFLKEFYKIYSYTMKKLKVAPLPFNFIKNLCEKLKPKNLLSLHGVFKGEKLLSASLSLYPNEKISLAYIQGTSEEGYKLRASPFIFHNLILSEFKKGYEIFSFGAVPKGKSSLIFFKKTFGAEEYDYPSYIWYNPWYVEEG